MTKFYPGSEPPRHSRDVIGYWLDPSHPAVYLSAEIATYADDGGGGPSVWHTDRPMVAPLLWAEIHGPSDDEIEKARVARGDRTAFSPFELQAASDDEDAQPGSDSKSAAPTGAGPAIRTELDRDAKARREGTGEYAGLVPEEYPPVKRPGELADG